ncbi:MAG: nucleotidyltransferase [Candidatus Rokubacteria bacterium]|nr:nucleotidyltransferase [Candidatus Rokubacteria bacterium]
MTEELGVLKIVTGRLDSAGIPYMVTGSIATNYYAVPRMTRDIDIVIQVSTADTDRLTELFSDDFYVEPEAVGRAIAARTAFNVIHTHSVVKVDFVVRKDSEYRREEFRRRRRVTVDDSTIFIVAPEDLIISKLDWARDSRSEIQLADVRNLLAADPGLDREYLVRWVNRLGLDSLYREVAG